jgi:hypothetical protein
MEKKKGNLRQVLSFMEEKKVWGILGILLCVSNGIS